MSCERTSKYSSGFSKYPAGSEVSLPRIAGHRDADATDCPGNALYHELPGIRTRALALSGHPVQATIALQTFVARVTDPELDEAQLAYKPNLNLRGPARLVVAFSRVRPAPSSG